MAAIQCRTCGVGQLRHRGVYKHGGTVAVLGYLIALPSVAGGVGVALVGAAMVKVPEAAAGGLVAMFCPGVLCLAGLALGSMMAGRRTVLVCSHCRAAVRAE